MAALKASSVCVTSTSSSSSSAAAAAVAVSFGPSSSTSLAAAGGDLTILAGVDPISNLGTALPVMAAWNSRSSSSLERSSTICLTGDLKVFIHSGSSLEEESRGSRFPALPPAAGLGRATRGRSSSLSSSIMMGAMATEPIRSIERQPDALARAACGPRGASLCARSRAPRTVSFE